MPRIAINGLGRIGRTTFKAGFGKRGFDVVAVNDLTDAATLAHLLRHDSVYRTWEQNVRAGKNSLTVGGRTISVLAERDPKNLPWQEMKIDVVLECTGRFTKADEAAQHLIAGAKRVIISAPAKGGRAPTYMIGVNAERLASEKSPIINNASCTTNAIGPVTRVIAEVFGVKKAMMTTVHAFTADQNLVDGPHHDWRRGRAAAVNIVPTTTGAAIATAEAIPALRGVFDGLAIRVPVVCGSLADCVFVLKRSATKEEVNEALKKAARRPPFKGVMTVSNEPLVSTDIIGLAASSIVDLTLTNVVGGDLAKVVVWYDNEWGYSHRLVELALLFAKTL